MTYNPCLFLKHLGSAQDCLGGFAGLGWACSQLGVGWQSASVASYSWRWEALICMSLPPESSKPSPYGDGRSTKEQVKIHKAS